MAHGPAVKAFVTRLDVRRKTVGPAPFIFTVDILEASNENNENVFCGRGQKTVLKNSRRISPCQVGALIERRCRRCL
jgi:hypothetical protein